MKYTKRLEEPRRFLQVAALHLSSAPDDTLTTKGVSHEDAVRLINTLLLKNKQLGAEMLEALRDLKTPVS